MDDPGLDTRLGADFTAPDAVQAVGLLERRQRSRLTGGRGSDLPLQLADMTEIHFTLYISGRTRRSETAIANLRRLGEEHLGGVYELVVIDAMENPEAAETDRVLATPTLIKDSPPPRRRVTGDLSDSRQVLSSLALPLERVGHAEEETQ